MADKIRLFISCSEENLEKVEPLYRSLSQDDDFKVLRDTNDTKKADAWKAPRERLIRDSDTLIFVLSPQSATSEVCAWELDLADALNKRIIPVVVDYVDGQVPPAVSRLTHILMTDRDHTDTALATIKEAISTDIDWIREHTRLAELADRWNKAMRPGAQLLRGSALQATESWLVEQPKGAPQPTTEHRRYILESRNAATRHQRGALIGALAALVVVGTLGLFGWTQRSAAVQAERKAQAALRTATKTSRTLMSELAKELSSGTVPDSTIRQILDRAQDLQSGLLANFPDDRPLRDSDAMARVKVGDTLYLTGSFDAARAAYEDAQAKQLQLLNQTPNHTGRQHALGVTLDRLGDLAHAQGKSEEARGHYAAARELFQAVDAIDPAQNGYGTETAEVLNKLGQIAFAQDDLTTAEDLFVQARDLRAALVARDPDNSAWQHAYAASLRSLSDLAEAQGGPAQAEDLLMQGLTIYDRLITDAPDTTPWKHEASGLLGDLADMARERGDAAASRAYQDRSLELARAIAQIDPQNTGWQRDLAVSLKKVGEMQQDTEEYDAARASFEEARRIILRLVLISPSDSRWKFDAADIETRLGILAELTGDLDTAAARYQAAADGLRDLVGIHPETVIYVTDLAGRLSDLAGIAIQKGQQQEALNGFEQALEWHKRSAELQPGDVNAQRGMTAVMYNITSLLSDQKDYDAAAVAARDTALHAQKLVDDFPDNAQLADDLRIVAASYSTAAAVVSFGDILFNRLEKAEILCRDALGFAPDDRRLQAQLAYTLMLQDKTNAAKDIYLAYRGDMIDNEKWEDAIRKDFDTFRKIGLTHPLMAEVEAAF